jgi:hypothetical protein
VVLGGGTLAVGLAQRSTSGVAGSIDAIVESPAGAVGIALDVAVADLKVGCAAVAWVVGVGAILQVQLVLRGLLVADADRLVVLSSSTASIRGAEIATAVSKKDGNAPVHVVAYHFCQAGKESYFRTDSPARSTPHWIVNCLPLMVSTPARQVLD